MKTIFNISIGMCVALLALVSCSRAAHAIIDTEVMVDTAVSHEGGGASEMVELDGNISIDPNVKQYDMADGSARMNTSLLVNSESDLELFAETMEEDQPDIKDVDSDDSSVEVSYFHQGKLFGFIPTRIHSRTMIELYSDGNYEVKSVLPWWSLFVGGINYDRLELEASLKNDPQIQVLAKLESNPKVKAILIEEVAGSVRSNAEMSMYDKQQ